MRVGYRVIVYPGEFVPEYEFMDEDGVVHQGANR